MKKILIGFYIAMISMLVMAQLPPIQIEKNVQYIEGGVGLAESDAIQTDSKNWPLELNFSKANGQQSEWISNVSLVIKDTRGMPVLSHQVDGPKILLRLNPGKYFVESTYDGQKKVVNVNIENSNHQKINIQWR